MIHPNILKSPNDKRNGYTYELDNKLKVIIIQDIDTNVSAVSMCVKIGYFQDTISGMAHFLEHMVFNGTKDFPDENAFPEFIAKYNGMQNAYTTHDHTYYYYTVSNDGLLKSMELFSGFFTSPILGKDCIDREKEAVNSEHIKNINSDSWRCHELLKVASHKNHCFNKFGTGCNDTLDIKDIDVHVRNFFEKYYSSDRMTLCIISKENIETVKKTIDKLFSSIQIKNIPDCDLHVDSNILNPSKLIKYIPIEDREHLLLNWEIPHFRKTYDVSPTDFMTYLLGNEMDKSVNYVLCNGGYITQFDCFIRDIIKDKCILSIDITLSPYGKNHKKIIIGTILEYIKILYNNIDTNHMKNIYDDLAKIDVYNFKYFEKTNSTDTLQYICSLLNDYDIDPKHIFVTSIMKDGYSSQFIENLKTVFSHLTIDNMILIAGSKEYDQSKMSDFPNYGTKYKVWDTKIVYTDYIKNISVPPLNPYISVDNNLIDFDLKTPSKLYQNNSLTAYWFPKKNYSPNVCINATILLNQSSITPENYVGVLLYLNTILTKVKHELYMMNSAMYDTLITFNGKKIYMQIEGNYGKISEICEYLLKSIHNELDDKCFETSKYSLIKQCENYTFEAPYTKLGDLFKSQIFNDYYSLNSLCEVVTKMTKEQTINIFNTCYVNEYVKLLISGNCTEDLANTIYQLFKPRSQSTIKPQILTKYKGFSGELKITNNNPLEENVAVGVYINLGNNIPNKQTTNWAKNMCLGGILENLISPIFFDQLRTKESFGYIVNSRIGFTGNIADVNYFMFIVQSPNKTVDEISNRIGKFIKKFKSRILELSQNDFTIIKNSFESGLKTNFNNLSEESSYLFENEIENDYEMFNYKNILINECKTITLNDIIEYYNKYFLNNPEILVIKLDKINKKMLGGGSKKISHVNCKEFHRSSITMFTMKLINEC
jgi:insulysin